MSKSDIFDYLNEIGCCNTCNLRYLNGRFNNYLNIEKSLLVVSQNLHSAVYQSKHTFLCGRIQYTKINLFEVAWNRYYTAAQRKWRTPSQTDQREWKCLRGVLGIVQYEQFRSGFGAGISMSRTSTLWMWLNSNVDFITNTVEPEETIHLDCIESKISETF